MIDAAYGIGNGLRLIILSSSNKMKYFVIILISAILYLQGCKAQKNSVMQEITIPKLSKMSEVFDIEKFKNKAEFEVLEVETDSFYLEQEIQPQGFISRYYNKNV